MKTGTIALLVVGGLAVYEFAQLGVAGKTVQILLDGVQINSITNFSLQLLVQNVSNANVKLNSMTGAITVNGNAIGNVSYFSPVTVASNSQQVVNVTLRPDLLSLPASIIALINNSGGNLHFVVDGNANIDGLVIPFTVEKDIAV